MIVLEFIEWFDGGLYSLSTFPNYFHNVYYSRRRAAKSMNIQNNISDSLFFLQFGNSLETFYASSRPFRGVASFLSPALRSATLPTPSRHQSSSSPQSPEKQVQPLISLRFLSSYRTMFYLLIFWFFCKVTSLHGLFVVLLWVLLLFVMLIFHLRTPFQKR